MRRAWRVLAWLGGGVVALAAAYMLLALLLGALAVNTDFRPTDDGVRVWVRTNGVHAEFIVPTRSDAVDWSVDHPASDMRRLAAPLEFVAFGWGDAEFFATTPTWSDLRAGTALRALSGLGDGAMHVEYVAAPGAYAGREIRVDREQYARLAAYIHASFARDANGRPRRLPAPGYFDTDAFYAAIPRYSLRLTSNDWVRRGLAAAGVRTPRWAPFDTALFYQLSRIDPR